MEAERAAAKPRVADRPAVGRHVFLNSFLQHHLTVGSNFGVVFAPKQPPKGGF